MKKLYGFAMLCSVLLVLTACPENGLSPESAENGSSGDGKKTAEPYPVATMSDINEWWPDRYFEPGTDIDAFEAFLTDTTGIVEDGSNCPASSLDTLTNVAEYMVSNLLPDYGHLHVAVCEYRLVSDVPMFDYTSWYPPISTLGVTLSDINETSVTNTLTESVGGSLGYGASAFSASITKESSKTVITSKGIQVATSYDLTQYEQDKLYKVVLTGDYAFLRCHFRVEGATVSLPPEWWNTGEVGYFGYIDGIRVRQDSLAVKLVHN